jgi:hypothetical protein
MKRFLPVNTGIKTIISKNIVSRNVESIGNNLNAILQITIPAINQKIKARIVNGLNRIGSLQILHNFEI